VIDERTGVTVYASLSVHLPINASLLLQLLKTALVIMDCDF